MCEFIGRTFKDWASEETSSEDIVSEMALAHRVKDSTVKAYRRGDLFEKRRRLMDAWAEFCAKPDSKGVATPMKKNAQ